MTSVHLRALSLHVDGRPNVYQATTDVSGQPIRRIDCIDKTNTEGPRKVNNRVKASSPKIDDNKEDHNEMPGLGKHKC